jgi:hypothetical protein
VIIEARAVSFALYAASFFGPNRPPGRYRFSRFQVPRSMPGSFRGALPVET